MKVSAVAKLKLGNKQELTSYTYIMTMIYDDLRTYTVNHTCCSYVCDFCKVKLDAYELHSQYVCMCMQTHTYTHIYAHTQTYICRYVHIHFCTDMQICICKHMQTHMHAHTQTHTLANTYTHIHTQKSSHKYTHICINMHTHVDTHTYTHRPRASTF